MKSFYEHHNNDLYTAHEDMWDQQGGDYNGWMCVYCNKVHPDSHESCWHCQDGKHIPPPEETKPETYEYEFALGA